MLPKYFNKLWTCQLLRLLLGLRLPILHIGGGVTLVCCYSLSWKTCRYASFPEESNRDNGLHLRFLHTYFASSTFTDVIHAYLSVPGASHTGLKNYQFLRYKWTMNDLSYDTFTHIPSLNSFRESSIIHSIYPKACPFQPKIDIQVFIPRFPFLNTFT